MNRGCPRYRSNGGKISIGWGLDIDRMGARYRSESDEVSMEVHVTHTRSMEEHERVRCLRVSEEGRLGSRTAPKTKGTSKCTSNCCTPCRVDTTGKDEDSRKADGPTNVRVWV